MWSTVFSLCSYKLTDIIIYTVWRFTFYSCVFFFTKSRDVVLRVCSEIRWNIRQSDPPMIVLLHQQVALSSCQNPPFLSLSSSDVILTDFCDISRCDVILMVVMSLSHDWFFLARWVHIWQRFPVWRVNVRDPHEHTCHDVLSWEMIPNMNLFITDSGDKHVFSCWQSVFYLNDVVFVNVFLHVIKMLNKCLSV